MKANIYKYQSFLSFILIIFPLISCQINDDFSNGVIESENSNIIDFADYHNLNLLITTAKHIYSISSISTIKSTFTSNINNYSMAASYNENYILVACLNDSLLSKININTGDSTNLINYDGIPNMEEEDTLVPPTQICSLSIYENIAYIAISNNFTNETSTFNKNFIIKINLIDEGNDGSVDVSDINFFKFPELYKSTGAKRQFGCEVIFITNSIDKRLVCILEKYVNINQDTTNVMAIILNDDINGFEGKEQNINKYTYPSGFYFYKYNTTVIASSMRKYVYNIFLTYDSNNIPKINKILYLNILDSDLNYYKNNYAISSKVERIQKDNLQIYYIQIDKNTNGYYKIYDYSTTSILGVVKLMGFIDLDNNKFYIIYESEDKIKYLSMNNNIIEDIFNIKSYSKTYKIISNDNDNIITLDDEFNQLNEDYGILEIQNTLEYQVSIKKTYKYLISSSNANLFPYDKSTNQLTAPQTNNYWYEYNFAFINEDDSFLRIFYFNNINITIETCAYQCETCSPDYYSCGNCRNDSYAKLFESTTDNNCYPIDQEINDYKYNENTKNFEKCYFSCKFCTEPINSDQSIEHKCKVCSEGFYPSYQYLGNCYKINEGDLSAEKYVFQESEEFLL